MRDERPRVDCPDRHVGCHADCKREQAWLETEQARMDGIYAAKAGDKIVDDDMAHIRLHVAGGYDKKQPRTVITVREAEKC